MIIDRWMTKENDQTKEVEGGGARKLTAGEASPIY